MKKLIMLGLALLLAGCGPDPVRIEKADAIRRESETQYLATATAVAIQARATAIAIADDEAVMAATRDDRIAWQENAMWWSTVAVVRSCWLWPPRCLLLLAVERWQLCAMPTYRHGWFGWTRQRTLSLSW